MAGTFQIRQSDELESFGVTAWGGFTAELVSVGVAAWGGLATEAVSFGATVFAFTGALFCTRRGGATGLFFTMYEGLMRSSRRARASSSAARQESRVVDSDAERTRLSAAIASA